MTSILISAACFVVLVFVVGVVVLVKEIREATKGIPK